MKLCFVSTKGNVRAAMAKSIFTKLSRIALLNIEVYSAGVQTEREVPQAVLDVLSEKGYPTQDLEPIDCSLVPYEKLDILITLSPEARDQCPYHINHKRREHWVLEEVMDLTDLRALRNLRDSIEKSIKVFLKISSALTRYNFALYFNLMIDITKLKTFVAVADLGSFSRASEILYITQPAVTQQIKSLEKMVGAELFQRQGGRIVLTEEGKRVYELAKALLKDYENLVEEMAKIKKDFKDSLFVGISTTLSEYKVPELLVEFHSQMPGIYIRAFVENSQQIEEGLSSGILNIGIIEREPSEKFRAIRWFYDEIIFFTHPSHPFAKGGEIEPEDLYSTELIFREVSSGTRKVVEEELERLGVIFEKLNIKIEINCGRSILRMVKCSYGCSFLSKGLLEKDLQEGNIVEVKIRGFNARRWYYVVFPDDSKTTFLANSFAKFLLSKTRENIIKDEERVNL